MQDGLNRRGLLECMGWAGTGLVWTMAGGVASSITLDVPPRPRRSRR